MEYVAFALMGLGSGAVFAALALGLVLSYRSAGVVNFATGAIALFGAYSYATLRQGRLLLLVPGLPGSVGVGGDPGFVASLLVALLLCALLGVLLHSAVYRRLRDAPPVAKAVASLGLMVGLQTLLAAGGATAPRVAPIFPRTAYEIGGFKIPGDRLWFAGLVVATAVAVTLTFRFTTFGTATRAAAESERGAIVTGLSPNRIAAWNWALSSATAGLGGVLIAPIVPLTPNAYTLMIVPALAAALVGGLRSILVASAAGLVIGMLQSEVTFLQSRIAWLPDSGLAEVIPLSMLLVYLLLKGRPFPDRGAIATRTLGHAPAPSRILPAAAAGTGAGALAVVLLSGSYRAGVIASLILGIVALSLVVVTGYAGQVSLAQLALAGVGAFSLSRLTTDLGVPFPVAPLISAFAAAVIGVVVGLPALRIRGLPVAVVTLALAVGLEAVWFRSSSLTGGFNGATVKAPTLFGFELGPGAGDDYPRVRFGLVCLACLVAVGAAVAYLRRSHLGSMMVALKANERAAAAMGIDVARTKIMAFAIGSFIAGLGGALLAYQQTLASPDVYSAFVGFGLFATVYIAGITSVTGGVLAGLLAAGGIGYLVILRVAEPIGRWYDVIVGLALVVNVIKFPEGLASGIHRAATRFDRREDGPAIAAVATAAAGGVAVATVPTPRSLGTPLLRADGLTVRYGGVVAVDNVAIEVPTGGIVGLIGPNGAGKTTVIDALSGFVASDGVIELGNNSLNGLAPHERTRRGLGRTFQGLELWEDLTVAENLRAVCPSADATGLTMTEITDLLGIHAFLDRPVGELSQGHRQLVSLARALGTRPRLLLLDEPAAGLDTADRALLCQRLRDIRDAGVTLVLIDHDVHLVLDVCDVIYVLDLGKVIASGPPRHVRADARVAEAYLGTTLARVGAV